MDKDKLKLLIRNLELAVDSLKAEVYSDASAYKTSVDATRFPNMNMGDIPDYDEIFEDSE